MSHNLATALTARLDAEAALAQRVADRYVYPDNGFVEPERVGTPFWPMPSAAVAFRRQQDPDLRAGLELVEAYNPQRVLREIEAKRRILHLYEEARRQGGPHLAIQVLDEVIESLAAVYTEEPAVE